MIDQVKALVGYAGTVSAITSLVSGGTVIHGVTNRIFGLELPEAEAPQMPRKALVFNLAGGVGPIGARDMVELAYTRVDAFCYGETALQALRLQREVHDAMKFMGNVVQGDALIRSATIEVGPRYLRDQDTDWPVMIETFIVAVSECAFA